MPSHLLWLGHPLINTQLQLGGRRLPLRSNRFNGFFRTLHAKSQPLMGQPGLRALRQLREGLGDEGEESLGSVFLCGGAALVVLEVAQGGLGVGQTLFWT
jgi:hypothetical protein